MIKSERAAVLGLLLSLCATPVLAFNPDCFCIRKNPNSKLQPYQVVRFASASCENERYTPSATNPWDDGITNCSTSGAAKPAAASTSSQLTRRCFCAKHLGGTGIQQYRVFSMPTIPECKNATYKENGKPAWENVLTCDALTNCSKASAQCKARMDQLTKSLSANPARAMSIATALSTQGNKCKVIEDDCFVKLLQ